MAKRSVFLVDKYLGVIENSVDFKFVAGLRFTQKMKSADSLSLAIKKKYPDLNILEVSAKSNEELGVNVCFDSLTLNGKGIGSIYCSMMMFESGVDYSFLENYFSLHAKHYLETHEKTNLIGFKYKNKTYPLYLSSVIYDYLYAKALDQSIYRDALLEYDGFSDFDFIGKKLANSQARSIAIYFYLYKYRDKDYYLKSIENFKEIYNDLGYLIY